MDEVSVSQTTWLGLGIFSSVFLTSISRGQIDENGHSHGNEAGFAERISDLKTEFLVLREGAVSVTQSFRVRVGRGLIKRGPVLNYLTVFEGPGGLILDNEIQFAEILRDGKEEPYHFEKGDGFTSLYVGSAEVELEPGDYTYLVTFRTEADWKERGGEFTGVFDVTGMLPVLPIDSAEARVILPEGVVISKFSPAVSGFESIGKEDDPGFEMEVEGGAVTVRTTRALGDDRGFFINLAWPSGSFAVRSQWMKVMRQHPRIPLAGFSGMLLLWALVVILLRGFRRDPTGSGQ